jgi:HlyD family secretion protein
LLAVVGVLTLFLRTSRVPVDLALVTRGPLKITVDEEGETRVRERYVVSAPLAGRVLRIELEPGDAVKAGVTPLARFLPGAPALLDARARAEAKERVQAALAVLGGAQARQKQARLELEFALAQLKRQQELAQAGVIAKQQLEVAELDARTKQEALVAADYAVRNAEHEVELARASLIQSEKEATKLLGDNPDQPPIVIYSPVDGVVLRRLRESQAVVPAGEPLLEVGDPADLEIVSDLLSTDAVKVRPGQQVDIERWGGGHPLRGRVRRIEPSGFTKISALGVEEQRVNVIIDFEDPRAAWTALGDAFRVEVRIVVWERGDVLRVPTSSLFRRGEKWAVFTVKQNKAILRTVEIGQRNDANAELLSGLAEGDQVIMHPSDAVSDGVAVAPRSP